MDLFRFFPGYETHIYAAHREPAFLMLVSFIVSLAGARFYTRMARVRGWGSGRVCGVHIHHFVPGIILSFVAGGLVVGLRPSESGVALLAILFGGSAALVFDEFALLLHLDDVYWKTEGRLSIDACMAAVAFLSAAVLTTFPLSTDSTSERLGRTLGDGLILLDAVLVIVTLMKGKLKLGLLGIVFAPLALVGAVRLARPNSIWARWRYPEGSRKRQRSESRSNHRQTRWAPHREIFYDWVGGRPHLGAPHEATAAQE